MTLKEIAKLADTSVSTVSRVLNDPETKAASKERKEAIWAVVRNSDYTPNSNAQNLRKGTVDAAPAPEEKRYYAIIYARSGDNKDLFFSELASVIEYEAFRHNYILKYTLFADGMDAESFSSQLASSKVSGIVVLGRFNDAVLQQIADEQTNLIYVGLNLGSKKQDGVFCDGYQAAVKAVEYLQKIGHKQIAYIGEVNAERRYTGYCDAVKTPLDPKLVVNASQTLSGGFAGVESLLARGLPFSAIFCANDATAMGVIRGLRKQKIKVPEDISVISIDDVEMSRYFSPMLTTIHIPIKELGKQTAKLMIDRVEKGHVLPMWVELPFSLSLRESCKDYS